MGSIESRNRNKETFCGTKRVSRRGHTSVEFWYLSAIREAAASGYAASPLHTELEYP